MKLRCALAIYVRHRWLPHRCTLCGVLVAPNGDQRHAEWHYHLSMLGWAASAGRGKKPKKPPGMRPGPSRSATVDRGWQPGDGRCIGAQHDETVGEVCCGGPDRLVCGVGRVSPTRTETA